MCEHVVENCVGGQAQTCDPLEGSSAEVCDGEDNDCDGLTDEELGTTACGLGVCAQVVDNCVDGKLQTCDPLLGAGPEACDGQDNDCDGPVDEDLGTTTCGVGVCLKTVDNCVDGQNQVCPAMAGAGPETCNGEDDDCDGPVDEDLGSTTCGLGVCEHVVENCVGGQAQTCDPLEGSSAEVCDGQDNDCDGLTDEELGTTACGLGVCAQVVDNCVDGKLQTCDPLLGAGPEACDGQDNDCDGPVDEDLGTTTCGVGVCLKTVDNCVDGQIQVCDALVGAGPETCDGEDDDCDGLVDEDLGSTTCGLGVCEHTVENCVGGQAQTCDPLEGSSAEVCDGQDNDCDGLTDEELGTTACGLGVCAQVVDNCVDGKLQTCDPLLGAGPEACDGQDNDCDGPVDEDLGTTTCGVGVCLKTVDNCVDGQIQVCDALVGAGPETCDGEDDDCDGLVDEDLGSTTCGLGVCEHTVENCVGGQAQTCDPLEGSSAEVCDGQDNDCDGLTDEELGTTACGLGVCAQVVDNCVDGKLQTCDPLLGAGPEACDGQDNDCDGPVDEDLGTTTCGVGVCLKTVDNCVDGQIQVCPAMAGAGPETCNGLDDDCDGPIDDGDPGGGASCAVAGVQGPCAQGIQHCQSGSIQCTQTVFPQPEVCDGQDNDCNGPADDGNPGGGGPCFVAGQQGPCAQGEWVCQGGSLQCVQTVFPQGEVCDGQDNNCNGQVDDGDPGGGSSCSVPGQQGPCAQGTLTCQSGSLQCAQTVFPQAEVCDGQDNDCNGPADDGNPGGGGWCSVSGKLGPCAQGEMKCQGGSLQCAQTVFPQAESCDSVDNDCNGQVDGMTQSCSAACGSGSKTCNWGNWTTCSGPAQVCTPGQPCCSNDGCSYKSSSTQCDSSAYDTEAKCTASDKCGGSAQERYSYRYCTGYSAECGYNNVKQDSYWTTVDNCSPNAPCSVSGDNAQCSGACGSNQECSNGQCVTVCIDNDGDNHYTNCWPYDCPGHDNDKYIYQGAKEVYDIRDNDCDGQHDELGLTTYKRYYKPWTNADWEHRYALSTPSGGGWQYDGHAMTVYPTNVCTGNYKPLDTPCSSSSSVVNLWGGFTLVALSQCYGVLGSHHIALLLEEDSPEYSDYKNKPGFTCSRLGYVPGGSSWQPMSNAVQFYRHRSSFSASGKGDNMWSGDPTEGHPLYDQHEKHFHTLGGY